MVRASRKRMRAAYARARRRRQIWRRRQEAPLPAPSAADDGSDDASEGDFAANTWQWLLRRKAESRRRLRHIDATWCVDGAEAHVEGLSATRVRVERPFRRAEPWAPRIHASCGGATKRAARTLCLCRARHRGLASAGAARHRGLAALSADVVAKLLGFLPSGRVRVVTTRVVNDRFEWAEVSDAAPRHVSVERLLPVFPVEGDLVRVDLGRGRVVDARLWAISELDDSAVVDLLCPGLRRTWVADDDDDVIHQGERVDYHFPLDRILAKSASRRDDGDDDDLGGDVEEDHFSMSDFDDSDDFASDSDDAFTDPDDY